MDWNYIYQKNKVLDSHFDQKYLATEPLLFEKNCVELTVEISEFVNETKCFKYWTIKPMKKDEVIEEAADVMMMLLYFYNHLNIDEIKIAKIESNDIIQDINHIFYLSTTIMDDCDRKVLDEIAGYLIGILAKLGLDEKNLLEMCEKKIQKVEQRLKENY